MNPIALDQNTCRNLDASVSREWLCTNGRGAYASGTIAGLNSRKYHGYLVAPNRPPVDRIVLLSRVEDRIWIGQKSFPLSTNEFPDLIDPQGYQNLISCAVAAGPVWRYACADAVIEKSVYMPYGQDAVVIRYDLIRPPAGKSDVLLHVQPMMAGRHFHATTTAANRAGWRVDVSAGAHEPLLLTAPQCPLKVYISHNADHFSEGSCWWYNFVLRQERSRGYPDTDDLWTPGALEFTLKSGCPAVLIASVHPIAITEQQKIIDGCRQRYRQLGSPPGQSADLSDFLSKLSIAADQFLVSRSAGKADLNKMSIIAGYPWFEDWGRDTFISLAGIALVTGNHAAARGVLVTFADHIRDGLTPNRFPDEGDHPDYNTVDASLWFVHAAYQYWRYTGDGALLRDYLYSPLCQIILKYRAGTLFGIHMDSDGLIAAGEPGLQLTWMDAKIGWEVVTPRHGKPVEIAALWYNALRIMEIVARAAGDESNASLFAQTAQLCAQNFVKKFWNSTRGCLYDVIAPDGKPDDAVRPNQILAVSLPFCMLPADKAASVVNVVQRDLLIPLGLRTLSPGSPGYTGHYVGDQNSRDHAYHQGTAWPWLIGPFVSAFVGVHGRSAEARQKAWEFIKPFEAHLQVAGLGSISEIADGESPHQPRGCIAQAWSVAEVLRCCWEDILGKAPAWPHEKSSVSHPIRV